MILRDAVSDSIRPLFVSENKTFEKKRLTDFEMDEGQDYTIRRALKTAMTEALFATCFSPVD
jgi:hypothetical protein